ncbi:MAG: hypothetical protein ACYSUQ_11460, partial [Planctomycetota bacterium]
MKIATGSTLLLGLTVAASATGSAPQNTETCRFALRSDPRVDLHHFLVAWASADAREWPLYALSVAERVHWRPLLEAEEQQVWAAAVETYTATVGRSFVLRTGLEEAFQAAGGAAPDRLWHDVIFYTTGEVTRLVL